MNQDMLRKILCDSNLQYKRKLEQFIAECDELLAFLFKKASSDGCTKEQKFVIGKLGEWMSSEGYPMIVDTIRVLTERDEQKVLDFIELYEFMLQCSTDDVEKIIDCLFYIPGQFMKQFIREKIFMQGTFETQELKETDRNYIVMRKGIFDEIPFFR